MKRQELISDFHQSIWRSDPSPEGHVIAGWSSRESQMERFAALLRTSQFSGGSVVDYGCGAGDLYAYLCQTGLPFSYRGLDQHPDMVKLAQSKYGDRFENIPLDKVDFEIVDYVFASGIFQFKDIEYPEYYFTLIQALFSQCQKAVAVNFLSDSRDEINKNSVELYIPPTSAVEIAQRISKFWCLDHSYHPGSGDMTLALHRREGIAEWKRPSVLG